MNQIIFMQGIVRTQYDEIPQETDYVYKKEGTWQYTKNEEERERWRDNKVGGGSQIEERIGHRCQSQ